MNKKITIGLFGTCGNSRWREGFIAEYARHNINYYNPQKENWDPSDAAVEADHLANDDIILFPVTNETSGLGSLGEVGFSILQTIRLDERRDVIVMIEPDMFIDGNSMTSNEYMIAESERKDSMRMRALVLAHLKKLKYPNVHLVKDLDNMLKLSLHLHAIKVLDILGQQYKIQL